MTQPLNYCTQALETIHMLAYDKKFQGNEARALAMEARDIAGLIHHAEKFILPDWGRIFTSQEWDTLRDLKVATRLPYPIVALEYPCDYEGTNNFDARYEAKSSKRISLCAETEAVQEFAPYLWHLHEAHFTDNPQPGFYVIPVVYSDDANIWLPPPAASFFYRTEDNLLQDNRSQFCIFPFGQAAYSKYPVEERDRRMQRDLADEMIAITHTLTALSIDRHGSYQTIPVNESVNRKRLRKGKKPLFEYKVLDIVADVMDPVHGKSHRHTGPHSSPRMHKRRGHIRRLGSGQRIWIRDTIVGKPGQGRIVKDYSVHE